MNVLLHICCGICASGVIERLRKEGFRIFGFFYNPNIHPEEEFKRRLEVVHQVSKQLDFELVEGRYDKDIWFKLTKNLANEPEDGKRCEVCFRIRLEETCKIAKKLNIPYFTTTLTISPHKNASMINKIGAQFGNFIERDFKKRDGFKLAMDFSKQHSLYRQNYCGCVYSMRQAHSFLSMKASV